MPCPRVWPCCSWKVIPGFFIFTYRVECYNIASHSESPVEKSSSLDGIDEELINARRALRTASWFAVFYLITTDILGPSNAPFAFSQVGYVPGAILYVVSECIHS